MLAGDDDDKTDAQAQAWGGRAGEEFDPCYHEACDRLDDVDRTALGRFTDAVDATLRHFAASTTPLTGPGENHGRHRFLSWRRRPSGRHRPPG